MNRRQQRRSNQRRAEQRADRSHLSLVTGVGGRLAQGMQMRLSCLHMLLLMIVPLVFGGVGIFSVVNATLGRQSTDALGSVPVVTGAALTRLNDGQQVMIEGRIGPNHERLHGDFVAYFTEVHKQRRVRDDSSRSGGYRWESYWEMIGMYRQPLAIDTAEHTARISSDSYDIHAPPHTITQDDVRWRGFQVGDTVMALGTTQGGMLQASVVHGGTKESYIGSEHALAVFYFWFGVVFIIVAVGSAWFILRLNPL